MSIYVYSGLDGDGVRSVLRGRNKINFTIDVLLCSEEGDAESQVLFEADKPLEEVLSE